MYAIAIWLVAVVLPIGGWATLFLSDTWWPLAAIYWPVSIIVGFRYLAHVMSLLPYAREPAMAGIILRSVVSILLLAVAATAPWFLLFEFDIRWPLALVYWPFTFYCWMALAYVLQSRTARY